MKKAMCLMVGTVLAGLAFTHHGQAAEPRYTIVIHGGAGADPNAMPAEVLAGTTARLNSVLRRGVERLAEGSPGLNVVEEAIRSLEDDPLFNAGCGAALNLDGEAELDAAVMNGQNLGCGAVAGVRRVKNPISLARFVMEKTPHVFFVGLGGDRLAQENGLPMVDPAYFVTPRAREALEKKKRASRGTVGCVVLDRQGNLVAGTSTGGLTGKQPGRVGDSPVIGAGTYADNRSCAVSCTGTGEEFIRHNVGATISHRMRFASMSLSQAVAASFSEDLPADIGGIIAVDRQGEFVMQFNTPGMSRGAADWRGHFEVAIGPKP